MRRIVLLATSLSLVMSTAVLASQPSQPGNSGVSVGNSRDAGAVSYGEATNNSEKPSTVLLKGQVNYVVPSGTPFKLKIATVPTSGMHLADRDWNGNLHPARVGQEITARTTEDLYVDDNKVIPEGTVFHGVVSKVVPPKRVSRPGSLVISFDHITTPDGRMFAFRAEANNIKASTPRTKAKGFGIIAAHTAGGAIVGALAAYQIFGMQYTVALHGYNIAGGAALGAIAATTYAIMKHGPVAVLEPGDDLNMEIDSDLLMPAASEPIAKAPAPHLDGLEVKVIKSKVISDGLDGHQLTLDTLITNNTDVRLRSIDLYLEDDNGSRVPLAAGMEEDSEVNFEVDPHSMKRVRFNFQLEYPKLKRKLIWYEHATHKPLLTQRLP